MAHNISFQISSLKCLFLWVYLSANKWMEIIYLKFRIGITTRKRVGHNELGDFNCYMEYLVIWERFETYFMYGWHIG